MSELSWDERKRRDAEHLADPQAGDYWHEMFTPICVVLGRTDDGVWICKKTKTKADDDGRWTWDLAQFERMTSAAFRSWLTYGGTGDLAEQTWCSVLPGRHAWARDAWAREVMGIS